jgi:hypothetical protein
MSDFNPIIIDKEKMTNVKICRIDKDNKHYLIVLWENGVSGMLTITEEEACFWKEIKYNGDMFG